MWKNLNSRLISSYEDKIVQKHSGGYIGKPFRDFYKRINITFAEFVTAVVVISRKKCREEKQYLVCKNILSSLSLLFSGGRHCSLNSHYNPYYFNCDYCNIPYHYIGRLENWDEDIANIAKVQRICLSSQDSVYNIVSDGKFTVEPRSFWEEKESNY